jgi:hypothetical protein
LTEDRTNFHAVEFRDMHSSPNNSGDLMKKNKMGGECSMYGGRGEASIGLW